MSVCVYYVSMAMLQVLAAARVWSTAGRERQVPDQHGSRGPQQYHQHRAILQHVPADALVRHRECFVSCY